MADHICKYEHIPYQITHNLIDDVLYYRLRWSMGSVLAFNTQVRGFKNRPNPSDFLGRKNPQHAFLRRGSKAVGPMS